MRPGRWPVRNVDPFPPGEGSLGCRATPTVIGLPLPLTPRHTNRTKGDRTARRWDSRRGCTKAAETSRVQPPDSGGHDSGYRVGDVGEGWVPRSTFPGRWSPRRTRSSFGTWPMARTLAITAGQGRRPIDPAAAERAAELGSPPGRAGLAATGRRRVRGDRPRRHRSAAASCPGGDPGNGQGHSPPGDRRSPGQT